MKLIKLFLQAILVIFLFGCKDDVDPAVSTVRVEGNRDELRKEAISKLYQHYKNSTKDKESYEIVSKGDYILNFSPKSSLLTLCDDQGSGWAVQYKDINDIVLKKMVDDQINFDHLSGSLEFDTKLDSLYKKVLISNNPIVEVKTNGEPRL
jgi:hypothetical protein